MTAEEGRLLALFDGPARAVRCGAAVAAIAARSGIAVRGGVHIGECEPASGDSVASTAGTIAALAQPGEVLVTRTVVDLVPGSGLTFRDQDRVNCLGRELDVLATDTAAPQGPPSN